MNHPSIKLLFVLVVLLFWTGVPAYTDDCDDPFDSSNCQAQDLNTNDEPGGGECGNSPIVVTSASSSGASLVVNLSNSSSSTEQGFVVTTVLLGGVEYVSFARVTVTAGSTQSILLIFPKPITAIGVSACANKPGGINEGPDVVGLKNDEEPE